MILVTPGIAWTEREVFVRMALYSTRRPENGNPSMTKAEF